MLVPGASTNSQSAPAPRTVAKATESAGNMTRPLEVHVLVDLDRGPAAGGHVKVWERLASAATGMSQVLDLTVHFSGRAAEHVVLADNVRFRVHRPVFSTARFPFLSHVPAHTDLGWRHTRLAAHLRDADVLHTTDAYFAFARTAEHVAKRLGVPLVSSVHTDTPRYTALFTAQTVQRLVGRKVGRLVDDLCHISVRAEAHMHQRLLAHQRRCAYTLVSRPTELERLAQALPRDRVRLLRRGVDRTIFSPGRRDRAWLQNAFGVPADRVLVLFVGRLDRSKNVLTLVEAVRTLLDEGWPLHLVCAGEGPDRADVISRLSDSVTCPGVLAPETLARIYASVDLFAQPSQLEECSNVVLEALASGLPVLASPGAGAHNLIDGQNGLRVQGPDVMSWTEALRALAGDAPRRHMLARGARAVAERGLPSWADVLAQDLLPVWQLAAQSAARGPEEAAR